MVIMLWVLLHLLLLIILLQKLVVLLLARRPLNRFGHLRVICSNLSLTKPNKEYYKMPMQGSFDANQFKPSQGGDRIAPVTYDAVVGNTSIEPTKDNTGGM